MGDNVGATAWNTVLIVLGWAIVHWLSRQRDRDKARRDLVVKAADALAVLVDGLFADAITYHSTDRNTALERKLKMNLQELALQLGELHVPSMAPDVVATCRAETVSLRRAVTRHHFEDQHTAPLDPADDQFDSIAASVLQLKRRLAQLKLKQFPV